MARNFTFNNFSFLYNEGFFRKLKLSNGIELIRAVYPAVRDKNWGTVPVEIDKEQITQSKEKFIIDTTLRFRQEEINFSANLSITIHPSGLTFVFKGQAHSSFLKNRIGLNLLLPVDELAGCDCLVTGPDQKEAKHSFPSIISPHQPFVNIRELRWRDHAGNEITARLEGDIFEIEDQRNWTDASFKIYSTPLHLPFPVLIEKGERIEQKISLRLAHPLHSQWKKRTNLIQNVAKVQSFRLPKIGAGASSEKAQMTDHEAAIITETGIDFCSLLCDLKNSNWKLKIKEHFANCEKMGVNVRLNFAVPVLFTATNELIALILERGEIIDGIAFYSKENFLSHGKNVEILIDTLKRSNKKIEIGGGTYAYYAELNRNTGLTRSLDYISFSVSPQVHAFDNLTLVENLQGIHYVVSDAVRKYGLPVDINALTLKQRMNFVATSKEQTTHKESNLPDTVDPRQPSELIALWTLDAISKLMFAGVRSVSLFETLGRRGIMQSESPLPGYGIFTEQALKRYPVYFVLRELLKYKEATFRSMGDLGNNYLGGFLIENNHEKEIWIWNLSNDKIKPPAELFLDYKNIHSLDMINGKWVNAGNIYSIGGLYLMSLK